MPDLFPAFLKLEGRRCIVVGGGRIAEQKLDSLLSTGASIRVIAPVVSPRIRELANAGKLEWIEREYSAGDLVGASLVIAGTGVGIVNERIFRDADAAGVLCNAVDEPDRCHFYFPAIVRRGDLQIAISTTGQSPALAQRIRTELEGEFAPDYAAWLSWLGRVRDLYLTRNVRTEIRVPALHRIARRSVYERFRQARIRRLQNG